MVRKVVVAMNILPTDFQGTCFLAWTSIFSGDPVYRVVYYNPTRRGYGGDGFTQTMSALPGEFDEATASRIAALLESGKSFIYQIEE